jgi:hypothetical protein
MGDEAGLESCGGRCGYASERTAAQSEGDLGAWMCEVGVDVVKDLAGKGSDSVALPCPPGGGSFLKYVSRRSAMCLLGGKDLQIEYEAFREAY